MSQVYVGWIRRPNTGVLSLQMAWEMSEIKTEIRYVGDHMAIMELHGGCVPCDKVHTREIHIKWK
jgi:hypothetical protein